jgi:DNA (cytosine-5)-methyltransferase 1
MEEEALGEATVHADVRTFDGRPWRGKVDLVAGGFPCVDVSLAGKGAGLDAPRSGLWFEFARIVREVEPRYVFVENVPGLVNRGLDRVLGALAELGFDAEWGLFSAAEVGAPHLRKRLFLLAAHPERVLLRQQPWRSGGEDGSGEAVASADGTPRSVADADRFVGHARRLDHAGEGARGRHADRGGERQNAVADAYGQGQPQPSGSLDEERGRLGHGGESVADDDGAGLSERQGLGGHARAELEAAVGGRREDAGWWEVDPDLVRVAHGVPAGMDRLRCLGNAVVPRVAQVAFTELFDRFVASGWPGDG